jgi:hypothetical protein
MFAPPAKPFGHFIDECRECSDERYRPKTTVPKIDPVEMKAEDRRDGLRKSLLAKGWTPSRVSEQLKQLEDVEF